MTSVIGLVASKQETWQFRALLKDKLQHLACHLVQCPERMIKRRCMVSVHDSTLDLCLAASRFEGSAQLVACCSNWSTVSRVDGT
jgi:hypothetical protein